MKIRLIFFLLLPGFYARAQPVDSLLQIIARTPKDTQLVLQYRHLVRALYASDRIPEMLQYAETGLQVSRELQFDRGTDLFIYYKASALDMLGRGREAIPLFEEGLQLATARGNTNGVADYHVNIGVAYQGMSELDQALVHFLAAYDAYSRTGNQANLSKILNNIGVIYRNQKKYDRAEETYHNALQLKTALRDSLGIAATCQNLASLYSITGRQKEAIEYLEKATALYTQFGKQEDVAGCQSLLGQIYFNFGQVAAAKTALLRAMDFYQQRPSIEYAASTCLLLGKISTDEKDYSLAEKYFREGIAVARQAGQRDMLVQLLQSSAYTAKMAGKPEEALLALEEAGALKDSLTETGRLALMEEMQAKFEVAQKDNALKINQLELRRRTSERNALLVGALLIALLALLVWIVLRLRLRTNQILADQKAALQAQTIRQLEQENQLTALHAMIDGQEKERFRIASDLHDGLGSLLSSIKSHFNALSVTTDSGLHTKTNRLIDDACGEVRRIAHNMAPRMLSVSGLTAALDDLCESVRRQGIHTDLEVFGQLDTLPEAYSVRIYRIIQELCHNVVKHARASRLLVQVLHHGDQLHLTVEDNGCGFATTDITVLKGLGLDSVEMRVQYLCGAVQWDSMPGEGTTVTVDIPL
jgi:two-component system, NarL family, sensor kinase